MTGFSSFNNCTGERVLNLLETGLRLRQVVVERITVIEFGVNDGGGNDARCGEIKVPEMEPGHGSSGHRVIGSPGRCLRPNRVGSRVKLFVCSDPML